MGVSSENLNMTISTTLIALIDLLLITGSAELFFGVAYPSRLFGVESALWGQADFQFKLKIGQTPRSQTPRSQSAKVPRRPLEYLHRRRADGPYRPSTTFAVIHMMKAAWGLEGAIQ